MNNIVTPPEITFTDENIEAIFGKEAAEDERPDRLKKYYLKNPVYRSVRANLPLRILVGHKGIGKSALFKICYLEDIEQKRAAIWIRPDDLAEIVFEDTDDLIRLIQKWKSGIKSVLFHKILSNIGYAIGNDDVRNFTNRASHFIATAIELVADIVTRNKISNKDQINNLWLNHFPKTRQITVYIDDLDRGWSGRTGDIRKISALLNALRDMSNDNAGLLFRVGLRSDVYFLVRTSDESTDKIEGSVIWYKWTNYEIFHMLVKRIATFIGTDIDDDQLAVMNSSILAGYLSYVMESHFSGKGHWENAPMHKVLLSLIRKRPRDLVKLCTSAATYAHNRKHSLIMSSDLSRVFEDYSQGRLQDTFNEYRTELSDIERLLFGMKPSKREKHANQGYRYSTADLLQKISNILQSGQFRFANNRIATTKDLAQFMYKINFLTARKETESGYVQRRYFDENRYLSSHFVDFGYDWEVHPAYRWALQPDAISSIFDQLRLSEDD